MVVIIGLCGLSGSGKDTAADHIARTLRKCDKRVCVMGLGDVLKEIVNDTCHMLRPEAEVTRSILWGDTHTKNTHELRSGLTVRQFLQNFGTEILRKHLGNDVFVNALCDHIAKSSDYDIIIVPDVRFLNEMRGLISYVKKTNDGKRNADIWMIHIIRDGIERMKHVSEGNAQLIMDIFEGENGYGLYRMETIMNNKTKNDLYDKVALFAEKVLNTL